LRPIKVPQAVEVINAASTCKFGTVLEVFNFVPFKPSTSLVSLVDVAQPKEAMAYVARVRIVKLKFSRLPSREKKTQHGRKDRGF